MVSADSELFRAHPDWAIGIPGRPRTESRQQLVLDMGRAEVVDHLDRVLGQVLESAPISYIKWDMNRNITEPYGLALPPERQGEFFHRYILGVYELYRRLTTRFPEGAVRVLRERRRPVRPGDAGLRAAGLDERRHRRRSSACASSGGRSLAYPLSSMGAHVSAVPNHQIGRVTPISTRAMVAFFGVFGYELDPTRLERRRAGRGRRAGRLLRRGTATCSSAAASSGSRARSTATATRWPG